VLDKRDELIASLAKGLGLVNDAGLARAAELKKRFPQQKLEQILESAALITKEGKHKLAHAFNQRVRESQTKGPAGSKSGSSASTRTTPARSAPRPGRAPDEQSEGALANSLHSSEPPAHDPLATPPSEDALTNESGDELIDEAQILAEPTIMLPDEELRAKPKPPAVRRPEPKKPHIPTEEEILAEPTLMVPDDEAQGEGGRGRSPLHAAPAPGPTEEEILSEPTILVRADEGAKPAKKAPVTEEEILSEPTILVREEKVELVPGSDVGRVEPEVGQAEPGELALPDDLTVGGSAPSSDSQRLTPGGKKRSGKLDRREFERRSKLRMSFEGMTLGDYEIEGELSRGAFGVVLKVKPGPQARSLAKERGFSGDLLAMKVMLSANDPEETRRFSDEVQVLINLNHPNIVRMFDAGGDSGLQYYAMEMIQGVDSRTLVREQGGKLPVLYAARIARDVASALESVHHKTIYHRDLKPANVMIDRASQPYRTVLIDFGLVAKQKVSKGDEGLILGTPSYMPPEQAKPKGGFGEVNATSDIYSLGATFYFLMTGVAPFPGKDPREIIKRVCSEPPPDPTTLNPEISKPIAAVCMKCLAKPQRDRYHSAALLVKELDKELASAQLKLKAKGFMRKIFGGGTSGRQQPPASQPPPG
jgi:serine/threonine protein kinase